MPAIASTGAMLTLGHMGANEGLGHNCRIGSRIRVARGGSQGKFLGASDDIKMPSTLTRGFQDQLQKPHHFFIANSPRYLG
jgi:hypothetical protein